MDRLAILLFAVFLIPGSEAFSRNDFPQEFIFGTASSAYQYEGAAYEGGKKPSIWDAFSHTPGKISDGSNADVTVDQYHRYKEDVQLMSDLGVDAYRFSIAWTRIFPNGKPDEVNEEGVNYYNNIIDSLLEKGLTPYVTLLHWDTPLNLEESYGSWLNRSIIKDFAAYAETCFQLFGDRVKHWITLNEPHMYANLGYNTGDLAPGRCSSEVGNCTAGDSSTEPYIAAHNFILAHAAAVQIYRTRFQTKQHGDIGITIDAVWYEPLTNSAADAEAAQRGHDFEIGWFLDPLFLGRYPSSMRRLVGNRLPHFTEEESKVVKGSLDFLGVNHYTSIYAADGVDSNPRSYLNYYKDHKVTATPFRNGVRIGQDVNGMLVVPWGFEKVLDYIRQHYDNPPIIVTENGISDVWNSFMNKDKLFDENRLNYLSDYLHYLAIAISKGCNVRGYFVWSLLDNWEWANGFRVRFGLYYVDYQDSLKRYPKQSALWFKKFLTNPAQQESRSII